MNSERKYLFKLSEIKKNFTCWEFFFKKKTDFFIKNITIDSRNVKNNSLFIAIKGKNNDGHDFIIKSIENGANCIIFEKQALNLNLISKYQNVCFIAVDNSLTALQDLARYKRKKIKAKVIGITGNVGKTTTREMIKLISCQFLKTYSTYNNYNNHIGLPLTIVNAPNDTECLILEMGMNHLGEIDFLTKIAKPDIAIITNVFSAHIGNFNNIKEIVMAKSEIFNGMNKNGKVILDKSGAFFNTFVKLAKKKKIKNIITVSTNKKDNADIVLNKKQFLTNFKTKYEISVKKKRILCELDGIIEHNILNSLFSFAVAYILNFNLHKVANKLSEFKIVTGRGNFERKKINNKNITIINDCYNSSPESLKSSIITLSKIKNISKKSRIVAIIGDMLELGEYSNKYHEDIANIIIQYSINNVICIGKESRVIFDKLPDYFNKHYFNKTNNFNNKKITSLMKDKDIILLKASHGMNFDSIIETIDKYNKK